MIKSKKGSVEIRGKENEVLAELSMIVCSLLRADVDKNDICLSMKYVFDKYDKKYNSED